MHKTLIFYQILPSLNKQFLTHVNNYKHNITTNEVNTNSTATPLNIIITLLQFQ